MVLFGSVLGAEMLWSMVEELGFLAFEWTEKTMDIMFEEVFEFAPESAQKATAWTGFYLLILLTAWGGFANTHIGTLRFFAPRRRISVTRWNLDAEMQKAEGSRTRNIHYRSGATTCARPRRNFCRHYESNKC